MGSKSGTLVLYFLLSINLAITQYSLQSSVITTRVCTIRRERELRRRAAQALHFEKHKHNCRKASFQEIPKRDSHCFIPAQQNIITREIYAAAIAFLLSFFLEKSERNFILSFLKERTLSCRWPERAKKTEFRFAKNRRSLTANMQTSCFRMLVEMKQVSTAV